MKKFIAFSLSLVMAFGGLAGVSPVETAFAASHDYTQDYIEGEAIVCIRQPLARTFGAEELSPLLADAEPLMDVGSDTDTFGLRGAAYTEVLTLVRSDTLSTKELIAELEKLDEVVFAEPNYVTALSEADPLPDGSDNINLIELLNDIPTGDAPISDEPTGDEPVSDEPTGDEPSGDEPTGDEPSGDEPVGDEPSGDEPSGDSDSQSARLDTDTSAENDADGTDDALIFEDGKDLDKDEAPEDKEDLNKDEDFGADENLENKEDLDKDEDLEDKKDKDIFLPFSGKLNTKDFVFRTLDAAISGTDYTPAQWEHHSAFGIQVPHWNDPENAVDCDETVIAILDTGVDYNHPDLPMWEADASLVRQIGGGRYGYNACEGIKNGTGGFYTADDPMDDHHHGTHCAGIAAAGWDGEGISGVANNASIMAVKAANYQGRFSTSSTLKAMEYIKNARLAGVNIAAVNNSWGANSMQNSKSIALACKTLGELGIVSLYAAGNEGANADNRTSTYTLMDNPYTVVVTNSQQNGALHSTSNYGAYSTDVSAPGADIFSTVPLDMAQIHYDFVDLTQLDEDIIDSFDADEERLLPLIPFTGAEEDDLVQVDTKGYKDNTSLRMDLENRAVLVADLSEMPEDTAALFFHSYAEKDAEERQEVYGYVAQFYIEDEISAPIQSVGQIGQWSPIVLPIPKGADLIQITFVAPPANIPYTGTVYMDNLALLPESYEIPYAYLTGTSMATPAVTGEAAILAAAFPDDSAAKRAARIIGSVTPVPALKGKNLSGGIANTEKALKEETVPVVNDAYLFTEEEQTLLKVEGFFFGDTADTLKLDNKRLTVKEWTDESIIAEVNHMITAGYHTVTVSSEQGNGHQRFELTTADNLYARLPIPESISPDIKFTDVTNFTPSYLTDYNGKVYAFLTADDYSSVLLSYTPETQQWKLLQKDLPFIIDRAATTDTGTIIAFAVDATTLSEYSFVQYDLRSNTYTVLDDEIFPEEFASFESFGLLADGNDIVIVGDIFKTYTGEGDPAEDTENREAVQYLYRMNPRTHEISVFTELEYCLENPYAVRAEDGTIYLIDIIYETEEGYLYYTLDTLDADGNQIYIGEDEVYFAPDLTENLRFSMTDEGILLAGPISVKGDTATVETDTWLISTEDGSCEALPKIIDTGISTNITTTVCDGNWYVLAYAVNAGGIVFATEPDVLTEAEKPSYSGGGGGSSNKNKNKKTETTEEKEPEVPVEEEIIEPEVPVEEPVYEGKVFADVSEDNWFYDAVAFVTGRGLFSGTSETEFSPNAAMTRGMLAKVLHNLSSNPAASAEADFTDVNGEYFADAVAWAAEAGIISGYGDGLFGPNDSITREQLAVMLHRFAGKPAANGPALAQKDAKQISEYALPAMRWAVEYGIISGKADNTLDPKGQATRAEVASMLMRFCQNQNL